MSKIQKGIVQGSLVFEKMKEIPNNKIVEKITDEDYNPFDEIKKLKTKINQLERRNHMIFKYVKLSYNKIIVLEEKVEKLEKEKNGN